MPLDFLPPFFKYSVLKTILGPWETILLLQHSSFLLGLISLCPAAALSGKDKLGRAIANTTSDVPKPYEERGDRL